MTRRDSFAFLSPQVLKVIARYLALTGTDLWTASRIRDLLPDRWKVERDAANREVAAAVRDPPA